MAKPSLALVTSDRFPPEGLGDWFGAIQNYADVTVFTGLREAVTAMRQSPFDFITTIDNFPEAQSVSLIRGLARLCPDAQFVVLAADEQPYPDLENLAENTPSLSYFPQPWDQEGLLALLKALLNDLVTGTRASGTIVNDATYQEISKLLVELQGSISTQSLYLVNAQGQVLAYEGRDDLVQIGEIASLLGGSFAALQEVGALLGEEAPSVNLIHRQGDNEDLYALSVGIQHLLILRVPSGAYAPKIGTVWYYARKAAKALAKLLAEMQPQSEHSFSQDDLEEELNAEFENLFSPGMSDADGSIKPGELMDLQSAYEKGLIPESMLGADEEDEMVLETDNREREEL